MWCRLSVARKEGQIMYFDSRDWFSFYSILPLLPAGLRCLGNFSMVTGWFLNSWPLRITVYPLTAWLEPRWLSTHNYCSQGRRCHATHEAIEAIFPPILAFSTLFPNWSNAFWMGRKWQHSLLVRNCWVRRKPIHLNPSSFIELRTLAFPCAPKLSMMK
jgi:hypothetical protein